jgi:hypothetical protein
MDELEGQAWLDVLAAGAAPTDQQVPGSEAQVFGDQQPQAQCRTADLVGQELADAAFQTLRVTGFGVGSALRTLGLHGFVSVGAATMQFFFEGRSG